jgi:rSAM/selenodomain-associated transferase 2
MRVSVIIPTLNEADHIAETISSLRRQRPHEIIIADGGSDDGTPELARGADLVLSGPRGRANQMNLGAAAATGDAFLFLHADCTLEQDALKELNLLNRYRVIAGCFRMRVDEVGWLYRSIDWCASVRVKLTGLVYGDQGLFLKRETFEDVGGFPRVRLMEDVFISKSLRRLGRIIVSPRRILVSPRRWQRQGVIRQTLRNWTLTALAAGGVHPDRLAGFYPHVR